MRIELSSPRIQRLDPMPNQTYAQLQEQLVQLNAQAEQVRRKEFGGVVAKIRDAIEAYGITPADLFGGKTASAKSKTKLKAKTKGPKFSDGKGGEWVGRGPRPLWLRDALAAGKSLADFAVGSPKSATPAVMVSPAKKSVAKKSKKGGAAKYGDGAGKTWSGRGPMPGWLKQAVVGGKKLEDFEV
jgi:DNA-binding protein H-NS